jgi:hypothetical protein
MPTRNDHIAKARHNEQFFSSFDINTTPFLDWVVNGIFYLALHYFDSYLSIKGEQPLSHKERTPLINIYRPDLGRSFFHDYMSLKDDSEEGRYDMRTFTPDEIRLYILPLLNNIKVRLRRFIPEI